MDTKNVIFYSLQYKRTFLFVKGWTQGKKFGWRRDLFRVLEEVPKEDTHFL